MWILAMAPPTPLGGKIFIALLMLGLAGLLVRAIRGAPFTGQSIGVAVVAAATVVIVLEILLPSSYGAPFHDRGVLAAIAGGLSSALLRPVHRETRQQSSVHTLHLSGLAFISGPLLGLILASLVVLLSDVAPVDRGYTFRVFTLIGTFAGLFGAVIVAVASASGWWHSSEADDQD